MRILVVVLATVLIAGPNDSNAQETNSWVGKKVVLKEPSHSPIRMKDPEGAESVPYFTVKRAHGDLLFIVSGENGYWVPSRELLTIENASDHLAHQIRLNPREAQEFIKRGFFRLGKKDYKDAIADFDAAIKLNPKNAGSYYGRALAWKRTREYERAIADFNVAIQLKPDIAAAYNERAWLWSTCTDARFRDAPKAIESALKACELASASKKATFLDTLAAAYAEAGDFAAAVKYQAEANELFVGNEQRKRGLARLDLYHAKKPYRE
jgi:tetratricopeptide (TPR) repeat protein